MSGEGTEAQRRGGGRKRRPNHRGGNEGFEKGGPEDEAQEGAATEVPEAPSAPTQASAPRDHDRSENGSNGHGQERYEEGDGPGGRLNLKELKEKKISELTRMARDLAIEGAAGMRKQELIFAILTAHAARRGTIYSEGVLECCRTASASCAPPTTATSRARRHLRLPVPDPPLQPAHRRHHQRHHPPPQGQRTLLRLLKVESTSTSSRPKSRETRSSSTT
jgi:hypothetical protein